MDAAAPTPPYAPTASDARFGFLQLFLSDSRLAGAIANDVRHRGLDRVFGIPRAEANLLTAVLLLGAASATYETARRIVHTPIPLTRTDAYAGMTLLRAAAAGVAGPTAAATPGFGGLLAFAVVGGFALPGLRRAAHAARLAERRAREHRIALYLAARRANLTGRSPA